MSLLIKNVHAVDICLNQKTDIFIRDGQIVKISPDMNVGADRVIDGSNLTALPGLFDMHVHFRDPGQTHKEDILTGCQADECRLPCTDEPNAGSAFFHEYNTSVCAQDMRGMIR